MNTYDWIVIGGGVTGISLAYELAKQGLSVQLLEQDAILQGSTRYGYGGIAYWAGTTDLTRQLCQESRQRYPELSAELDADIQFRELDLLLTIAADQDPQAIASSYQIFATPPQLLSVSQASELEPLLNPAAIAGALTVKHGHVFLEALAEAYTQAFLRLGRVKQIDRVQSLLRQGDRVTGVIATGGTYQSANVVVCAGGWSRRLLQQAGVQMRLYFTHAELIETPPLDVRLQTFVMPADTQRFALEAEATQPAVEVMWDRPGQEVVPPILDVGVVQLLDGRLRMGQVSRALTDPEAIVDAAASEALIRAGIEQVLPDLRDVPGTWHHCLVAFSADRLPLVGPVPGMTGLQVFSGFSNPLAIVPPLAVRFAQQAASGSASDVLLTQLLPGR